MSMDDPWTLTPQAPASLPAVTVQPAPRPVPAQSASRRTAVGETGPESVGETTVRMNPVAATEPEPERQTGSVALSDVADPVEHADGTGATAVAGRARPDRRLVAGILVVVLLAGAGAWGVGAARSHARASALESARSSCTQAVAARDKAWDSLSSTVDGKDAATAKALKAADLERSDSGLPARLRAMLDAASRATRPALSCSAGDTDALDAVRARADGQRDAWERERADIDSLVSSMLASRSARGLADAKAAYDKAAETGRELLASSRGKVADNATLTALERALDANPGTDAASLNKATTAIDKACAGVRASVDAKTKADKAKADEQARQQAESRNTGTGTGAQTGEPQWSAPQSTQAPQAMGTPRQQSATPDAGSSDSAPSWSVPAPSGDGALTDRDPGL